MAPKRNIKKVEGVNYTTIKEAYHAFEAEKRAVGLVEKTLKNYRQSLEYFLDFCGFTPESTNISFITKEHFTTWVNSMRETTLTPMAINHYLSDCRVFCYWCMHEDRKYIPRFKIELLSAQEAKKKTYDKDDIKKLLRKPLVKDDRFFTEWRNWAIANLIYDMGARASTIIEIQLGDVDLSKRTIYLRHTKNKALAHMRISAACVKVLKEYMAWRIDADPTDYLFCNVSGEQLTYNALAHSFRGYCKDRGSKQGNLHGIRHTFATELAGNTNGDMVRVQKALGHSSIDMARKYVDMAAVDMGNYDEISPLSKAKDSGGGRPKKKIHKI